MCLSLGILTVVVFGSTLVVARAASGLNARTTTTDVCADVREQLIVPGHFGTRVPIGIIDKCICLSQILVLVKTDPLIITAVVLAGESAVKKELTDLVEKTKDHQTCYYPDHAEPICEKGSPCSFHCKDGFTGYPEKNPVECVCKAPHKVCNGVCGPFKACPSGKPHPRESLRRRALCGEGFAACGIYGWSSGLTGHGWECVNTATDLESCGGCAIPLDEFSPQGVDCTAITGVADVACLAGSCVVQRCAPGYKVSSADRTSCSASTTMLEQK